MGKRQGNKISSNKHGIKQKAVTTLHLFLQTEPIFSSSAKQRYLEQLKLKKLKAKLLHLQRWHLYSFNACFLSVTKLSFTWFICKRFRGQTLPFVGKNYLGSLGEERRESMVVQFKRLKCKQQENAQSKAIHNFTQRNLRQGDQDDYKGP